MMPRGKKSARKNYVVDHIACPHCGGELYISAYVSKSRRRNVNRGPKRP